MDRELPSVLHVLADRYSRSPKGRTGNVAKDYTIDFLELLTAANAEDGDAREQAEQDLRAAVAISGGKLCLDTHPRDDRLIERVRLRLDGGENWLFTHLKTPSPSSSRQALADVFERHRQSSLVPADWANRWLDWLSTLSERALHGGNIEPFDRKKPAECDELLALIPRLLAWRSESLIRFASCVLCGSSKRLGNLRAKLEAALDAVTQGQIGSLRDLGITENPRVVKVRGALRLILPEGTVDAGLLQGGVALSEIDIRRAERIECGAARALTVENEAAFVELAKRSGDTLLIQTSFSGKATLALIERLPLTLPLWHFGDCDPAGFDILRDLRQRSGRQIQSLHMSHYRANGQSDVLTAEESQLVDRLLANEDMADCHEVLRQIRASGRKGAFEQEMLGPPTLAEWPYYSSSIPAFS